MNDHRKRQRVKEVLRAQRAQERAAFPLSPETLRSMFDWLNERIEATTCDHSRRLTSMWLEANGFAIDPVFQWLDSVGGCCDCEVVLNAEEHFIDAMTDN